MRTRHCLAGIAFFLALSLGSIAARPITAEVGSKDQRLDVFPKPPIHFSGGILATPDVEYADYVGFRSQQLDLYRHNDSKTRPLVIWIHGGGWDRGDYRASGAFSNFPAVLASVAARGYVVASVNYRLSGEAKFPAAILDVKAAIRFLRAHAGEYGIDASRVYVWGGSAGGQLAALAATSCNLPDFTPPPSSARLSRGEMKKAVPLPVSDCVQGAVIWYGLFDLGKAASTSDDSGARPIQTFLGCETGCDALAAKASAITYLSPSTPPMLILCGTDDGLLPQSQEMAKKMKAMNLKVETKYISDTDHGWIAKTPERTRSSSLEALQATVDYLDRLSGNKPR